MEPGACAVWTARVVTRELCSENPQWVSGPTCKRRERLDLEPGLLQLWIHRPLPVLFAFKLGHQHKDRCFFNFTPKKAFTPNSIICHDHFLYTKTRTGRASSQSKGDLTNARNLIL